MRLGQYNAAHRRLGLVPRRRRGPKVDPIHARPGSPPRKAATGAMNREVYRTTTVRTIASRRRRERGRLASPLQRRSHIHTLRRSKWIGTPQPRIKRPQDQRAIDSPIARLRWQRAIGQKAHGRRRQRIGNRPGLRLAMPQRPSLGGKWRDWHGQSQGATRQKYCRREEQIPFHLKWLLGERPLR